MEKVTFKVEANLAALAKAIHEAMKSHGWSMHQAKVAAEKGEVDVPDKATADSLVKELTKVGAEDIHNPFD